MTTSSRADVVIAPTVKIKSVLQVLQVLQHALVYLFFMNIRAGRYITRITTGSRMGKPQR